MKKYFINHWGYIVTGLFVLIACAVALIFSQNLFIPIHDNLDGMIPIYKMLSDNNLWSAHNALVPTVSGIDRNYFPSEFKAYCLLYMILPAFWAFISGCILKLIISIFGFIYLLKSLNLFNENKNILVLVAFLYGLIPVFPAESLSFATLPFLAGALINYYRKPDYRYLIFFLIYPIFSSFAFFGFFILALLTLIVVANWIIKRKIKFNNLYPVICLGLTYVLSDYRMFYVMFFGAEETIRALFETSYLGFFDCFKTALQYFFLGQYHCGSLHSVVIAPVCLLYLGFVNFNYLKTKNYKGILKDNFNIIFALIIFNVVIASIDSFWLFRKIIHTIIPALDGFSFARAIWLNPLLWYLAFGVTVSKKFNFKFENLIKIVLCFLAFGAYFLFNISSNYNLIKYNIDGLRHLKKHKPQRNLTYREFFSEDLFNEIKKDIEYKGEWSLAYGMHPAILQYNGIKTLDGYASFAPSDRVKEFKKLIEPELRVDEKNANYYNAWPSRSYLYSTEISYAPIYKFDKTEANLLINPDILRCMKGKYIFSRVKILNSDELGLIFANKYQNKYSPYDIYLYKTNND